MAAKPSRPPTGVTPDIIYKMDDYMDNMAKAITKKKSILEKLVVPNAKKAYTATTQAAAVLALSDEVKQLRLKIIRKGGADVVEEASLMTS